MPISFNAETLATLLTNNSPLLNGRVEILPEKRNASSLICSCKLNVSSDPYLQDSNTANKHLHQILVALHKIQKIFCAAQPPVQFQVKEIDLSNTKVSGRSILLQKRAHVNQETKDALGMIQRTVRKVSFRNTLASVDALYNLHRLQMLKEADFQNCSNITLNTVILRNAKISLPSTMKLLLVDTPIHRILREKIAT